MITPRRITLTWAPGLRALQRSVAAACPSADARLARATAVLVPTRSAAARLRRTLEDRWLLGTPGAPRAIVLPDIVTRGDFYGRLHERALLERRLLSEVEREVLMAAAARDAISLGCVPPFRMRPGLVAEMLAFHDALARQQNTVDDFERLVLDDLEPRAEFDRGAERLLRQTRFLAAAFRSFHAKVEASGALDEHGLRSRLLDVDRVLFRRVVVTMGDRVAEPSSGLYPADFDLLSRLPHVESIDVLATRTALLAGLGERLRALFPGLEERSVDDEPGEPLLVKPMDGVVGACFVSRDREEELRDIARRVKRDLRQAERDGAAPPRVGVVFRRPLPYVYLGRTVFESAGMDYQAADALPLAAEPFSGALDLVFSAVAGRFARRPLLQLLRSPHFRFAVDGQELRSSDVGALDRALGEANYLGEVDRLRALVEQMRGGAGRAGQLALRVASVLSPLSLTAPASTHLARLLSFVREHERPRRDKDEAAARHLRARAALLRIVEDLRSAAERHDDPAVTIADLAPSIRRWVEAQTFTPTRGTCGVELVDASSARYASLDDVHIAGLVAGDWPAASARTVFYPPFLLSRLGWPSESERLAAERAAFTDLLRLGGRRVSVSAFTLEDDSIIEPSPLLDEIEKSGLGSVPAGDTRGVRIFADEAIRDGAEAAVGPMASSWRALRADRSSAADPRFHGHTQPDVAAAAYTITGIDRYIECPFKYFARTVLALPEEVPDEQGMTPRERGRFVHEVFRAFFAAWETAGGGAISVDRLEAARSLFARVVEEQLSTLPASEAMLERLRLLGSVAAPGLGEIAIVAEAVRPTPVTKRLLEHPFEGEFLLSAGGAERRVRLRGKTDRADILADGRLRVIDYKIGRAPEGSIQLPLYALCLAQQLEREGRPVEIGEALYIAFGERERPVQTVVPEGAGSLEALEEAQARALSAIEGIERGEFPPRPSAPRLCGFCAYAPVCRRDVVDAD